VKAGSAAPVRLVVGAVAAVLDAGVVGVGVLVIGVDVEVRMVAGALARVASPSGRLPAT
jgi:hypothetical protein